MKQSDYLIWSLVLLVVFAIVGSNFIDIVTDGSSRLFSSLITLVALLLIACIMGYIERRYKSGKKD